MGTWGMKTFENDDALDWVGDLTDNDDLAFLEQSLQPEGVEGDYLQAPDGVQLLCAGEVIAALKGNPGQGLPEEVTTWVGQHKDIDVSDLLSSAIENVDRVLAENSELHELWQENQEDYPVWKQIILDLKERLSS